MDYQKGKIYAIRASGTEDVYIGSTCSPLSVRMAGHRSNYKAFLEQRKCYITSFKILERGDAYIELLEDFPCASKDQLNRREGELIRATAGCVNRCIPGRTHAQYYQEHKETILEQKRVYQQVNKEALAEKDKQYYQEHKEQILEKSKRYNEVNKQAIVEVKKKYREANRQVLRETAKKYYEANKQAIKERRHAYASIDVIK